MKVKVSYTVNIEEVPEEIRLILSKAESKLGSVRRAITKLTDAESESSSEEVLVSLASLRKEMFDADVLLADSESILRGYLAEISRPEPLEPYEEPITDENKTE